MSERHHGAWRTRVVYAIGGGIAGTTVMVALLVFLDVQTRSQLGLFEAVSRFAGTPGQPTVGFFLLALAGIVVWPLLFVLVEPYLSRSRDPRIRGLVFTVVLWSAFFLAGLGSAPPTGVILYGALTLVTYLLYGFALGEVYARGIQR